MTPELIARYDRRVPRYTSYPTAPHFSPAVDAATYAGWLAALPRDTPLSLYMHVPFCAELCLYCGCHTTVARRYAPIAAYVDLLEREIAMVAAILGDGRPAAHIHWGGGTPTALSPADLGRIGRVLAKHFKVERDAEIAVEIDPRTLTEAHVAALAEMGVNRASLGVQDFDAEVQRLIGRIQSFEETARAAAWLRAAGVTAINLDLMYGLPGQTVARVERSIAEALRLSPERIALFGYAHVPWMKKHQALIPEDRLPDAAARLAQLEAATEIIRGADYVAIGFDHFARAGDPLALRQKRGDLHRNFQGYTTDHAEALIGFGTSSIGTLPQGYIQNAPSTVAYREAIMSRRLPTVRGFALSDEDRLRRAVIERLMCDLAVDLDAVARDFGGDGARFADELDRVDALAADGLVERRGHRLVVPDEARPLVRSVCAVFDRYLAPDATRHAKAI
jgi:oxygen-independent coproporphyrinogen-3 oxidase